MKTELLNLNKIFTDRIFRIPDYQRGYAWRSKQLKEFWGDLTQLECGKNHYVGVLTFEDVEEEKYKKWVDDLWIIEAKCFSPLYIVDGQQRLTTSIILIQCIIEYNNTGLDINYSSNNDIRRRFISDSKDNGISKSYIFGYEKDNPSYEYLKTDIFLDISDSKSVNQETIYTHNLRAAKDFFCSELQKLSFEEVEELYKKITQHCLFNIYSISDDIDVYVTFETMNNRGKPLSILELLKNRLIFLSTRINACEYDRVKLRNIINEAWKNIYHYLGRNKNNPLDDDIFLLNHFFYYFGEMLFKDEKYKYRFYHKILSNDYKDYLLENLFNIKNLNNTDVKKTSMLKRELDIHVIYKYVRSLKSSVEIWFKILNPDDSNYTSEEIRIFKSIYRLNRNLEYEKFMVLILVFYEKVESTNYRKTLLELIEKMLFYKTMTSYRYFLFDEFGDEELLELSVNLASDKVKSTEVLSSLNGVWLNGMNKKDYIKEISEHFKNQGFYQWSGIRYFLYEYEQYLKSESKTGRDKLDWCEFIKEEEDDYISVEHIYPQTARKNCWSSKFRKYNQAQRNALKHSLGNLLPVSKAKNSSLSNRCFNEKKNNAENMVGYSYGCYSEVEVSLNDEWDAISILKRGIKLTIFFQKRWHVHFSSKREVLDFLGLDFLISTDPFEVEKVFKEFNLSRTWK